VKSRGLFLSILLILGSFAVPLNTNNSYGDGTTTPINYGNSDVHEPITGDWDGN